MNEALKVRLVGAVVIVGAALVLLVLIIDNPEPKTVDGESRTVELETRVYTVEVGRDTHTAIREAPADAGSASQASQSGQVASVPNSTNQPSPTPQSTAQNANQVAQPSVKSTAKPVSSSRAVESKVTTAAKPTSSESNNNPETAPAAPDNRDWIIQVGSYQDSERADNLREQLISDGYQAFIMNVVVNGSRYYRVRVGPINGRAKADQLSVVLAKQYRASTRVLSP